METFVVRVFVPGAVGETPLAGVVEHVGTGWSAPFGNKDELLAAFRSWLERDLSPVAVAPQKRNEEV